MKKVVIIAEAGVNHNGDITLAKKLIKTAADAGADYVKFQSFKADKLVSLSAKKADYQIKNTKGGDGNQFNMLKKLELSHKDHLSLIECCEKNNIKFLSTAFDADGVDYLNDLNLEVFKSPSGEITNFPYLRAIAKTGKNVILSTGMSTVNEIEDAIIVLEKYGCRREQITVLHCTTEYPTPFEEVNLKAMHSLGEELSVKVGYSDHTLGIEVSIAAVALGAEVIEKHFTLDRNMDGPDHKASLEPGELKSLISSIRNVEKSMSGDGKKAVSISESKNKSIARKSIFLAKNIKEGEIIKENYLISLRPGDGISPMQWEKVIGKKVKRNISSGNKISWEDLTE